MLQFRSLLTVLLLTVTMQFTFAVEPSNELNKSNLTVTSFSHAMALKADALTACLKSTANYNVAAGSTSYAWTVTGGSIVTGQGTNVVSVYWTSAGAQTISVLIDGKNTASSTVTVNGLPTASIAVSETSGNVHDDGIICSGATATLTGHGGSTYTWSTGASSSSINTSSAGTYTVTATDANGCSSNTPASQVITVDQKTPVITTPISQPDLGQVNIWYYTDLNASNYVWTISSAGNLTSSGGLTDNKACVTWINNVGASVSVKYTDSYGCPSSLTFHSVNVRVPLTDVSIVPSASVEKGKTLQLSATITPSNANNVNLRWQSHNKAVATVDTFSGNVTAISVGIASIQVFNAPDFKYTDYCDVTIFAPASGIALNVTSTNLSVKEKKQLTAILIPTDSSDPVTWTSEDASIASVSTNGLVTAVSPGTTRIIATANGKSAYCDVQVPVPVGVISLDHDSIILNIGRIRQLTPTISPPNAADTKVTWVSYLPNIATVDTNGYVKGIAKGTTSVAAITRDGNKIAICNVTVVKPVTSVTISTTNTKTLVSGDTLRLVATVKPDDASDKTVVWRTNAFNIATIDQTIGFVQISSTAYGYASFTATCSNGVSASYGFSVYDPYGSIRLDKDSISLAVKDTAQLKSYVYPTYTKVYWEPSVPQVATVDNGMVTAIAVGKTKIYAYMLTAKGEVRKDSCVVYVYVPTTGVTFDTSQIDLALGMQEKLNASVFPPNASNSIITWVSSNPNIVSVNNIGYVVAHELGTAKIIVTAADGLLKDTCDVNVYYVNTSAKTASGQEFTIYPNPFSGSDLTIKLKRPSNEVKIKILDILGRVVYQNDKLSGSEISLQPAFGHGIYMILVESENDRYLTKIIVP